MNFLFSKPKIYKIKFANRKYKKFYTYLNGYLSKILQFFV